MRPALCSSTLLLLLAVGLHAADPKSKEVPAATIAKQVAESAKTKPPWWDQVTLDYPQTLDLTCPKGGAWNSSLVPGNWMWDIVNPNADKWKEGTKFWHFVLTNAKQKNLKDAEQQATMNLGHCYGDLLQDWPRAVYWYQQIEAQYGKNDNRTIDMANAYWRMGNRTLAVQTIKPIPQDATRHGSLIKLWADLGDYKTAYQMAQTRVAVGEDIAWFMSGYTAQLEGAWTKALDCFKKAEASDQKKSGRDWKQVKERATSAIQAITLFETLDLKRVPDGKFAATSTGYTGPLSIEVVVAGHKITALDVTRHSEKQYYAALDEMPAKIIAKQHVKGVDATLGATITAEAIVYATAKALNQAKP
ncbi:MAG: FMN-binding protein [Planctomycetes bacterium]|nr:FMN-binding protein [Planctomycetota bacterium]